ncbi:MAG TPA: bifunctional phosphopantothenoylcysteine decarboxylase/phosphopantothenate synthase [Acidimicrobiales bacterium]|nr:bifunctional phosphopantothenoylcysteine decarboxylase/phosphopantothenate synthase [Acidimicrobiales bacterium]
MLSGRRIVLGVSGGIAAYKAIDVCRRLVDAGAHVVPVLTRGALHFVGETTFSALASERAHTSLFDDPDPIPHTRLGQSADLIVVAPATARVIGTYAAGISNDLLTATLLATRAPVVLAPAMHTEMWEHPAVQDNLTLLARRGVHIVAPEEGRLAGGDVGKGRLAAPETIVAAVRELLGAGSRAQRPGAAGAKSGETASFDLSAALPARTAVSSPRPLSNDLDGLHVLVTAGGTREPIDPVRYIGNRSSGKQGHALAHEAADRGAKVTLVTTTSLPVPAGADVVRVDTAAQMAAAVDAVAEGADIVVMAAAVADFRPAAVADRKLKKRDGVPEIALEPTIDILAGLGARKRPGQTLAGFAAETDDLRKNAASKLVAKGADLVVANDVTAPGAGFEHDTNKVTLLFADGSAVEVPLADKRAVARRVFDAILERRRSNA